MHKTKMFINLFLICILIGLGIVIFGLLEGQIICSEKIGISMWDAIYEELDDNHYNCCRNELHLGDNGYYNEITCKAFVKE